MDELYTSSNALVEGLSNTRKGQCLAAPSPSPSASPSRSPHSEIGGRVRRDRRREVKGAGSLPLSTSLSAELPQLKKCLSRFSESEEGNFRASESVFGGNAGERQPSALDPLMHNVSTPVVTGTVELAVCDREFPSEVLPSWVLEEEGDLWSFNYSLDRAQWSQRDKERWQVAIRKWTSRKGVRVCGLPRIVVDDRKGVLGAEVYGWDKSMEGNVPMWMKECGGCGFSGLFKCGSRWGCAVCGPMRAAKEQERQERAIGLHLERHEGGVVLFWTGTMPHDWGDGLKESRKAVSGAWTATRGGRKVKRLEEELGYLGYVRAVDVTHGTNGWHPHIHALLFLSSDLSDEELLALEEALYRVWSRHIEGKGWRRPSRKFNRLERVRSAADVARYVARSAGMSLSDGGSAITREVVGGHGKRAREGHRTVGQLYREAAETGDEAVIKLCLEAEVGLSRGQLVTSSKYVQGLLKEVDEQLAQEEAERRELEEQERVLMVLLPLWFFMVAWSKGWTSLLLEIGKRSGPGLDQLCEWIDEVWNQAPVLLLDVEGRGEVRRVPPPDEQVEMVEKILWVCMEADEGWSPKVGVPCGLVTVT